MNLLDFVFPRRCFECAKEGFYICNNCLVKLPVLPDVCPVCERFSIDGLTHSRCTSPYSLDGLISVWVYTGVIKKALIALKYKFAYEVAKEVVVITIQKLTQRRPYLNFKNPILIPIPAHPLRKNWRGFNQAEIIGQGLAKNFGWNFTSKTLLRQRISPPQAGLKGRQRKQNVRGVFELNPSSKSLITNYQSLIIFDDIWTTGSTLKEAAKVLKRNGAVSVWGLTIARVV